MPAAARQSRTIDAYARLKDEILTNRMAPGFQAPEPDIALRLGMSRTPVREALIRLEAEGLVELIPRRGARVLPIRPDDMAEIYEILTALEPEAAANLAASRPDAGALAPLEEAATRMEDMLAQDDLEGWARADDAFHRQLLSLHGNKRLTGFVSALFDQAHRARMVTLRMRAVPVQSTAEHREILAHLRTGDAEATRQTFRRHRQRAADELLGLLAKFKLGHL